jgi:hypothetical protein
VDKTNLMEMMAVIEEECRSYKSAAMMAPAPALRERYERCARREAAALRAVRREMARGLSKASDRCVNACINRLLDTQIDVRCDSL